MQSHILQKYIFCLVCAYMSSFPLKWISADEEEISLKKTKDMYIIYNYKNCLHSII